MLKVAAEGPRCRSNDDGDRGKQGLPLSYLLTKRAGRCAQNIGASQETEGDSAFG